MVKNIKKSREFLKYILGKKQYDEFFKYGKIEIESEDNIYDLYLDGRIINKTTCQKYCVVPEISNFYLFPDFDILAIKYAWLKYANDVVDEVARKTFLTYPSYNEFVVRMEDMGWVEEELILNEKSKNFISIKKSNPFGMIELKCPYGYVITMKGYPFIHEFCNRLKLKLTGKNGKEIKRKTKVIFTHFSAANNTSRTINHCFYDLVSPTTRSGKKLINKKYEEIFRWSRSIYLFGGDILKISIFPYVDIKNLKLEMDINLWINNLKK